jgi:dipeptide/tripeptide permease
LARVLIYLILLSCIKKINAKIVAWNKCILISILLYAHCKRRRRRRRRRRFIVVDTLLVVAALHFVCYFQIFD